MANLVCDRQAAAEALGVLSSVLPRKTTIPAIGHVRVAANGSVDLAATDLERTVVWALPRTGGAGEGAILLRGDRFAKYVKESKAESLEIAWDGPLQAVVDGAMRFVTEDAQDFPTLPEVVGKKVATVPVAELAARLREVEFARSTEVVRYALIGVLFELRVWKKGKNAHLVASDGKRLAIRQLESAEIHEEARLILPDGATEAIAKIARALRKEPEAAFEVYRDGEERVAFVVPGRVRLHSRLIIGHFPDWDAVIPAAKEGVRVGVEALLEGLRKVEPALTEKTMAVKLSFEAGTLTLKAKCPEVGEATSSLPYAGSREVHAVLNPLYVRDFLRSLPKGTETVEVRIETKDRATLWLGRKGHRYVLMPLTISI